MHSDGRLIPAADQPAPTLEIVHERPPSLDEYGNIPIAFEIRSVFNVSKLANDSFVLSERIVSAPVVKDYDLTAERPVDYAKHFDLTNWGLFGARVGATRVGSAAVAFRSPGIDMLERRDDLAVLWDIRVSPEMRGKGVGSALLRAAESWASANGATSMKVETQNINVPACRFYSRHGYVLRAANHGVYAEFPDEIQLLWYKDLQQPSDD